MIILLFAFGTATAMALPIVTAILGLVSALALISILGLFTDVPTVAPTLATMIGLGVGIDYALFIVTRHKLQLRDGMEMQESIARATATAGGAVLFAGTTVVIALALAAVRRASRSSPRSATARPSRSWSPCSARRRCCRRCSARSARGSTRCG